jgi:hypothetical protein
MPPAKHPFGCTCKTHADRPWNRSEHWSADEVLYLEGHFGSTSDEALSRHLGRSIVGIRLKAKRLGLRKKDAGLTGSEVARLLGVDPTQVIRVLVRRGLLRASHPYRVGNNRVSLVMEGELERFIREHGEWVDVDRMPDSVFRDIAVAGGRWHSLPAVQQLTGRHAHVLAKEILGGRWSARKRGPHWMVHESRIDAIRATAGHNGRTASMARRERRLEARRNVRKGIEMPAPHPLLGRGRVPAVMWRIVACEGCQGTGRLPRKVVQTTVRQRVLAYAVRQTGSAAAAAALLKLRVGDVVRASDEYSRRTATMRRPTVPCDQCSGKGRVMRNRDETRQLPAEWAA